MKTSASYPNKVIVRSKTMVDHGWEVVVSRDPLKPYGPIDVIGRRDGFELRMIVKHWHTHGWNTGLLWLTGKDDAGADTTRVLKRNQFDATCQLSAERLTDILSAPDWREDAQNDDTDN